MNLSSAKKILNENIEMSNFENLPKTILNENLTKFKDSQVKVKQ